MSAPIEIRPYLMANGRNPFGEWIEGLRDAATKARIITRIDRMATGNFGVSRSVGEGVVELKIDFGPGFRVYYLPDGLTLIILLLGGDKDSQNRDIALARKFAIDYRSRRK